MVLKEILTANNGAYQIFIEELPRYGKNVRNPVMANSTNTYPVHPKQLLLSRTQHILCPLCIHTESLQQCVEMINQIN
jgi:hypothetical protein